MLEQLKHQSSKVAPRHLNRVSTITLREIELKSMLYFFHSTKSSNERNERTFPAKFVLERSSVLPPADAAVRRRISERHVRVETGSDEFLGAQKKIGVPKFGSLYHRKLLWFRYGEREAHLTWRWPHNFSFRLPTVPSLATICLFLVLFQKFVARKDHRGIPFYFDC